MDKIIQYYRLCTVRLGAKAVAIPTSSFTKKEITLYFREHDGAYMVRESVVGGKETYQSDRINARGPIQVMVYDLA